MTTHKKTLRTFRISLFAWTLLLLSLIALPEPVCAQVKISAEQEYQQARRLLRSPPEEGIPLYQKDPAEEAVRLFESAAEKKHIPSLIHLGSHYLTGNGVEQSAKMAFRYYGQAIGRLFEKSILLALLLAAVLIAAGVGLLLKLGRGLASLYTKVLACRSRPGNPKAQHALALRYLHGIGTYKQAGEARALFEKAAEQGYAPAQVEFGRFFEQGLIVKPNRVLAAQWYSKAAEQGDPNGLFLMGKCHEKGIGVALYLPKALGFYLLAAAYGSRAAQQIEPCRQNMTERQIQTAQTFALDYAKELGLPQPAHLIYECDTRRTSRVSSPPSPISASIAGSGTASAGIPSR